MWYKKGMKCNKLTVVGCKSNRMKFLIFFAAFLVLAAGYNIKNKQQFKIADKEFLLKQQKVFDFLNHVNEEYNNEIFKYAKEYSIEENIDNYSNAKAVKDFVKLYKQGLVPRFKLFSLTFEEHRDEAVALFNLFYYAKDWETFYKTACWARGNINLGVFAYSFSVAIFQRDDCQGLKLPAPYEVFPFYFVTSDVLAKAHFFKQQGYLANENLANYYGIYYNNNNFYIYNNQTYGFNYWDEEQKVSYFTQDVGLNSAYFNYHMNYPFWLGGEQFGLHKDRRGELYYYVHQQLLARYYLERLANGLGEIPTFDWRDPIKTAFNPNLRYLNGFSFPSRQENFFAYRESTKNLVQEIEDYEQRIRMAITRGYVQLLDGTKLNLTEPEDIETLGRFVQNNPDLGEIRFYDYLSVIAKYVLGASFVPFDTYDYVPSALEQFQSTLRDPVFYQLYKRFLTNFFRFKEYLPSYTKEELYYPGVKVEKVEFSPLRTYFENYTFDITNTIYLNREEMNNQKEKYVFWAQQERLNHEKFSFTYDIVSDKDAEVSVKLFFGPKYDEFGRQFNLNDNKYNFVEVDYFTYSLKNGKNSFVRKSTEFSVVSDDRTPARDIYKKVLSGIKGEDEFKLDMTQSPNGWPMRLLLPKGKRGGMVYQFYVMVTPFKPAKVPYGSTFSTELSAGVGSGSRYLEDLPFGFPLDREIDETNFYTPNMYFGDLVVYHSDSYQKKNVVDV